MFKYGHSVFQIRTPFLVDENDLQVQVKINFNLSIVSPRFLCRPTTLYIIARAVERQSAIYTENS